MNQLLYFSYAAKAQYAIVERISDGKFLQWDGQQTTTPTWVTDATTVKRLELTARSAPFSSVRSLTLEFPAEQLPAGDYLMHLFDDVAADSIGLDYGYVPHGSKRGGTIVIGIGG